MFTKHMVAHQLKCAGVLEAVRVSRVGFSQRFLHAKFVERYRFLAYSALNKIKNQGAKRKADVLVASVKANMCEEDSNDDGIQTGRTKVFLRKAAFEHLEKIRGEKIVSCSVLIQSYARTYIAFTSFRQIRKASVIIETFIRMNIAKKKLKHLRRHKKATVIQNFYRMKELRHVYKMTVYIARWSQRIRRGKVGRASYFHLNSERKSKVIQAYWRRYINLKEYKLSKSSVQVVQCMVRIYQARSALKTLRAEARDIRLIKEERNILRQENEKIKRELELMKERILEGRGGSDGSKVEALVVDLVTKNEDAHCVKVDLKEKEAQLQAAESKIEALTEQLLKREKTEDEKLKTLEDELASVNEDANQVKEDLEVKDEQLHLAQSKIKALTEELLKREQTMNDLSGSNTQKFDSSSRGLGVVFENKEEHNEIIELMDESLGVIIENEEKESDDSLVDDDVSKLLKSKSRRKSRKSSEKSSTRSVASRTLSKKVKRVPVLTCGFGGLMDNLLGKSMTESSSSQM